MFLLQAAIEDFKMNTTAIAVFWAGILSYDVNRAAAAPKIFSQKSFLNLESSGQEVA